MCIRKSCDNQLHFVFHDTCCWCFEKIVMVKMSSSVQTTYSSKLNTVPSLLGQMLSRPDGAQIYTQMQHVSRVTARSSIVIIPVCHSQQERFSSGHHYRPHAVIHSSCPEGAPVSLGSMSSNTKHLNRSQKPKLQRNCGYTRPNTNAFCGCYN